MSALLELEGVEARYGPVRALHGITLQVPEGAIVAVLGANGAGKTTTLRAVSGTVRRTGKLVFDGRPLRAGPEAVARTGIAHVPEGRGTFTELTVLENLRLGADYAPWNPKTHFQFAEDHGRMNHAVLRCVGVGMCRRLDGGTMPLIRR